MTTKLKRERIDIERREIFRVVNGLFKALDQEDLDMADARSVAHAAMLILREGPVKAEFNEVLRCSKICIFFMERAAEEDSQREPPEDESLQL